VWVIAAFPDGGHQLGYLVVNSASRRRSAASVTNRCLLDQLGSASRLKAKGLSLGFECLAEAFRFSGFNVRFPTASSLPGNRHQAALPPLTWHY